ncbi:aminopeptidase N [Nocardioides panacisoli]|uniref:Aminopeptidase N n=1 Tax=Nocardioides panacisoli TaxID=627624 RepID=A0ABP7ITH9_9ACTN
MPGTNLTREEATARAALIDVTSYTVDLDLTQAERDGVETFGSTTTLRFTCREPGAETFADLVDATIEEITLNGVALDPSQVYADSRITLAGLEAENELVVRATCAYSHTGEGLHHFVDPADGRVYLYSQFEVPDARRVFTTFEQPDLKSVFTFNVTAPAHWKVVSNAATPEPVPAAETGFAVWSFPETKRMSTYITCVVAGDYYEVQDVYRGKHGDIPLGHYARQSLKEALDAHREEIVLLTQQGFAFFEDAFDSPYPFGKYDQLYVPEYNMGAMENAGAITIKDEYIPRSRMAKSIYEFRASLIHHEMAHMWFGDLVTMKWWNDLWLNESFAEWACYHSIAESTSYTDAWTGFANARKQRGYREDQLPSTHPIAAEIPDLHAIETNFDMVTYAKGASVLKQLVAWVGQEPFFEGLRGYFRDHAWGNTVFDDLLDALEKASGRELSGWAQEWLRTAGTNTLAPEFDVAEDGTYGAFAVRQSAPAEHPTLRRHRIGIGLYDLDGEGRPVRREYVEVDIAGERTELPELVGKRRPDLLLLNDGDLTFAKIRLDEQSLRTAVASLSRLEDSLARALVWGAAWDMTRDAEMSATEYVELVLANFAAETDAWAISMLPAFAFQAVNQYSAPEHRAALRTRWERGVRELLGGAEPASEQQLSLARAFAGIAHSPEAVADLRGLLDGTLEIDGLAVDQDLRWLLINNLARLGEDEDRIAAELERDNTIMGQEKAAGARAARPTAEAKAEGWRLAMLDGATPNETALAVVMSFPRIGQEDVLAPYVDRYLEAVPGIWDRLGAHRAQKALEFIFPRVLATQETLDKVDAWLAAGTDGLNPGAVRYVREARSDVARALAAQQKDAE